MSVSKNRLEYITDELLKDLGFIEITHDHDGCIDLNFERGYKHPSLDPKNLILVDYNNGCWHFAQRRHAINGIGQMRWLDELILGFEFATGDKLLK